MAANKAFERTLEVEPHETGHTVLWEKYIAPEESAQVRALIGRAAAGEAVGDHDNVWVTKSGRRLSVSWSCIRLPAIDERRLLLVSGVDVTERKQRERQLQRERDITSTLMQAIPSIVVVVDREGIIVDSGVDPTRAGVNEAFREALGWPDGAIVRTSVLELIDPGDGSFARTAIASAANGVASAQRETRWRKADGDDIVIAWTATPVADVTGREASLVLLSGVDVTERRRQDEEIRASRARIIEAADEARRVLERNLHDGAQQRLVALSVSLRLAEARAASGSSGDGSDHQGGAGGARRRPRGAPRARPRHPPCGADRSGPRRRRRSARRAHPDAGDGDDAPRAAARSDRGGGLLRRRRRPSRTSSSTRARRPST